MKGRMWSLVVLAILLGCDGHSKVSGYVVDADGKAIEGASVVLLDPGGGGSVPRATNSEGAFSVATTHYGGDQMTLRVTCYGYETHTELLSPSADIRYYEVVLKRKDTDEE